MWVLATDIDNTLTGDEAALRDLAQKLEALRRQDALFLILATGRRLAHVIDGFTEEHLPQADAVITQVGTEIYLPPFSPEMPPLAAWTDRLHGTFSRQRAMAFLQGIDGLQLQPAIYNTPLKVSAFLDSTPDPDAAAQEIARRIANSDVADDYRVIYSSGVHLDIIPAQAGKGNAIHFLLAHLQRPADRLVVAGDSGNDLTMFSNDARGIIVSNAQAELKRLREAEHPDHFFATEPYAAGVAQGLRHFGVL